MEGGGGRGWSHLFGHIKFSHRIFYEHRTGSAQNTGKIRLIDIFAVNSGKVWWRLEATLLWYIWGKGTMVHVENNNN